MPNFNIVKTVELSDSFRVRSTLDMFTMTNEKVSENFKGEFDLDFDWNVGCIVGASGTGKTTVAKELFSSGYIVDFKYKEMSVLDDMPKDKSLKDIHQAFTSVGFSSPPDWLKPYWVLSNGQKMRVDLARSLLEDIDVIAFDEFTSVINREVAKTGSLAIQKSVRKSNKKFIAITVHRDILDWLQPDWIFDTDDFKFHSRGLLWQRPDIKLQVFESPKNLRQKFWAPLSKYHYLDDKLHNAARQFIGVIDDVVVAHTSYIQFPMKKGWKRGHRLVVHPDYQGVGIGTRFQKAVAQILYDEGFVVICTTTTPALVNALRADKDWCLYRFGRAKNTMATFSKYGGCEGKHLDNKKSDKRVTFSFCFKGRKTKFK